MELINATRMAAAYTLGMEPSGRELLVVVIKGTFRLPRQGEAVTLHEVQRPLTMADTFTADAGFSAPRHEVDFAPTKPCCDVLLLGSAYSPGGRPAAEVPVRLKVGMMTKQFLVVGDRLWQAGVSGVTVTPAEPFQVKPISYDLAFGGLDKAHQDPSQHSAYMPNPVGRGYLRQVRNEWVDGKPLPNTEVFGQPVERPDARYTPMAFGPIGRNWEPRFRYAGTYDQHWQDHVFPFLPADFDPRYYQAAPVDQQLLPPVAGAEVSLVNLTEDGRRDFVLPNFEAPVHVFRKGRIREDLKATLDTIVFEPDEGLFTMSWRVSSPLRRSLFEIAQIVVGRKGSEWWQRRESIAFPIPVVAEPAADRPGGTLS